MTRMWSRTSRRPRTCEASTDWSDACTDVPGCDVPQLQSSGGLRLCEAPSTVALAYDYDWGVMPLQCCSKRSDRGR